MKLKAFWKKLNTSKKAKIISLFCASGLVLAATITTALVSRHLTKQNLSNIKERAQSLSNLIKADLDEAKLNNLEANDLKALSYFVSLSASALDNKIIEQEIDPENLNLTNFTFNFSEDSKIGAFMKNNPQGKLIISAIANTEPQSQNLVATIAYQEKRSKINLPNLSNSQKLPFLVYTNNKNDLSTKVANFKIKKATN